MTIKKPVNIYTEDAISATSASTVTTESSRVSNEKTPPPIDATESVIGSEPEDSFDYISQSVYDNLPLLLKESCDIFTDKYERDVYLLGALAVLGGSFHNLFAYNDVDKKKVATNLLSFIIAPPASGKGALKYSIKLADEIKNTFASNSKVLGSKSTSKLRIPANSSASGLIQLLNQNDGVGIMVESEIDTLVNANKQDWGNYSDILRNSFDNESASLYRKTDKEHIELENLKMSLAISGTPGQFKALMLSAENGLFSRAYYYVFDNSNSPLVCFERMNNVKGKDIDEQFADFAITANDYYNLHLQHEKIEVIFNRQQLNRIQSFLQTELNRVASFTELRPNFNRSFTLALKTASLLALLRECEAGSLSDKINCPDSTLKTAISLMEINLKHSYKAYELLPVRNRTILKVNEQRFYNELPKEFTRAEAILIGKKIGIEQRTVDSHLRTFKEKQMVEVSGKGHYKKKE